MAMFFKIIICVIVILAITSPLWWSYTEAVQAKIAISESRGGLITARSFSWKARMEEFLQNPLNFAKCLNLIYRMWFRYCRRNFERKR